jgi:hypothetical protein
MFHEKQYTDAPWKKIMKILASRVENLSRIMIISLGWKGSGD